MMVVTSVPFFHITAFAANGYVDVATDAKVQAVETSMKKFEVELAKDKSYSNVVPAYKAYVACQQGLDAYIYGGESNALTAAQMFDTAVAGMTEFTGIKANKQASIVRFRYMQTMIQALMRQLILKTVIKTYFGLKPVSLLTITTVSNRKKIILLLRFTIHRLHCFMTAKQHLPHL